MNDFKVMECFIKRYTIGVGDIYHWGIYIKFLYHGEIKSYRFINYFDCYTDCKMFFLLHYQKNKNNGGSDMEWYRYLKEYRGVILK